MNEMEVKALRSDKGTTVCRCPCKSIFMTPGASGSSTAVKMERAIIGNAFVRMSRYNATRSR